ncbi:MAG: Lon protease family protein [Dehalococcoidia bacterium]
MSDADRYRVPVERLRWQCDPAIFRFQCTDELTPLEEFIGQDRALSSLEFGLALDRSGYNIFVTGLTGTGKASAIKSYVEKAVEKRKLRVAGYYPDDWCYVYNFADPSSPQTVRLPVGRGKILRDQALELLDTIKVEIGRAFGSEEYQRQRQALLEEGQSTHRQMVQSLETEAKEAGFVIQFSPVGVNLVPLVEGRPMEPQEFAALPEADRQRIEEQQAELLRRVGETVERLSALQKETMQKIKELERRAAENALARPFQQLLAQYQDSADATRYLEGLRDFTLDNIGLFQEKEQPTSSPFQRLSLDKDPSLAFEVNVFVDNSGAQGPPVIIEPNPTWSNLFGKVERRAIMGTYVSDHTMLKPGAVHLANSGYLVLNIRDVLLNPGVWEALKRVLKTKQVRLEEPLEQFGFLAPHGLRPQAIPAEEKIIVTGDDLLYRLLAQYDEDFWELFKVKADFDFQIERTQDNLEAYAAFIGGCCQNEGILHFTNAAVAKVAEYGAKLVADQDKLSSRFGQVRDLLVEADYWARQDGAIRVGAQHVQKAVEQKLYRSRLIEERIRELIAEGTLMVDVDGEVVGQVNGLAVYDVGDFSFGKPSRITAKTFMGRRGVINIERESQLSGRIHDKGVLILSGYLGYKYAQDKPLSLSASLCFEQSYEGVEGDSASSAELYAILSSLSGLPTKQAIAVTGSVNQKGEVQPIGGVNQKIEGFFDVCKAKGLTGQQGVIVPHQNVRNLMLREDVVEAVKQGQFHIYAITTVDEGIEILTGVAAGDRQPDGSYPEGTVNYLVDQRLGELAEGLRGFYREAGPGE